jgi:peptide/nickel transport system permease protein
VTAIPLHGTLNVSRPRRRASLGVVGALSVFTLAVVVVAAVFAPVLAPYSPLASSPDILSLPSVDHWLGTDTLGRDVLSRIMFGGRVTLLGTITAISVFAVIGIVAGIVAGSSGPKTAGAVMRMADLMQSLPGTVILLVVLATFSNDETAAMVTLGVIGSPALVRVVRATALGVRESDYVSAARVAGLTQTQIQARHIFPAIVGPALTQITLFAAVALLVEASLGYLGLGVPAPEPTWGNLVADAQNAVNRQPWLLIPTGGIITLTVLCLGLVGNALRDAYASRSSRSPGGLSWRSMRARVTTTSSGVVKPAEHADEPLLSVVDMSIEIAGADGNRTIVERVSFTVTRGEAVGIVGESGCGKSITVAGILRVLPPGATVSATSLRFDGRDLQSLSEEGINSLRGTGMAYISQEPISSLDPSYTAGAQLAEAVRVHRKVSRRRSRQIALELLTQVQLRNPEEVAKKYPFELSGGMAQRIAIARALAGEPKLLIADEPTTALDVTVQAEILDLLHDLRRTTGMSLILVTHDWGVLADSCDRTIVMYAGEIVETAALVDLIAAPKHPYALALLEANPEAAEVGQMLPTIPGRVPPPGEWPIGCHFANRCTFASEDCSAAPIPLMPLEADRTSRCIHVERLSDVTSVVIKELA